MGSKNFNLFFDVFKDILQKKLVSKLQPVVISVEASVEVKALTIQSCSEARTSTIGLKVRDLPDLPTKYLSRLVSTTFQQMFCLQTQEWNYQPKASSMYTCQLVRLSACQTQNEDSRGETATCIRATETWIATDAHVTMFFSLWTCQETSTAIWQWNLTQIMSKKKVTFKTAALKRRLVHSWDYTDLTHHISPKSHFVSNNDSRRNIKLSNLKQGTSDSNLAKRIQRTSSWSFKKKRWHWKPYQIAQNPTQNPNKIRNSVICVVQNTQNHRWLRLHRCITPKGSTKVIATKGQLERPKRECQQSESHAQHIALQNIHVMCVASSGITLFGVVLRRWFWCLVSFSLQWFLFRPHTLDFVSPGLYGHTRLKSLRGHMQWEKWGFTGNNFRPISAHPNCTCCVFCLQSLQVLFSLCRPFFPW